MPRTIDPATQHRAIDPLDSDLLKLSDVTGKAGFGCSILRRARIKVFVLCPAVKDVVCVGGRWETAPCTAPLLSASERETGVCESCAAGWEADMNRLATSEEVAEHEALMAGVAWERRRGMSTGLGWAGVCGRGARPAPLRRHQQDDSVSRAILKDQVGLSRRGPEPEVARAMLSGRRDTIREIQRLTVTAEL